MLSKVLFPILFLLAFAPTALSASPPLGRCETRLTGATTIDAIRTHVAATPQPQSSAEYLKQIELFERHTSAVLDSMSNAELEIALQNVIDFYSAQGRYLPGLTPALTFRTSRALIDDCRTSFAQHRDAYRTQAKNIWSNITIVVRGFTDFLREGGFDDEPFSEFGQMIVNEKILFELMNRLGRNEI